MKATLSTMELRHNLGEILNRVDLRHEQFVIERKGKQMAAIIPIGLFNEIQEAAREHVVKFLDELSGDLSDDEAMALANEVKQEARALKKARK